MPPCCQVLQHGTEGTGYESQDVDECPDNSTQPHNCSCLTLSNNTNGSSVGARRGTWGTGLSVRMWMNVSHPLPVGGGNMTCHNTPRRYDCTCIRGLAYGAGTCVSEEDCLNTSSMWHPHAACLPHQGLLLLPLPGQFPRQRGGVLGRGQVLPNGAGVLPGVLLLLQHRGFLYVRLLGRDTLHGTHCVDVDECEAGNFTCPDNSTSTNSEGSYCCPCDMDYQASNNSLCLDINESAVGLAQCPNTSDCQNTPGSFVCDSWEGY